MIHHYLSRVLRCFNCVLTICLGLAMRVFLWRTLENLWEHTEMMSKLGELLGWHSPSSQSFCSLSRLWLELSGQIGISFPIGRWVNEPAYFVAERCSNSQLLWLGQFSTGWDRSTIAVSRPFKYLPLERGWIAYPHSCWWILHLFAGHLPFSSFLPSIFGSEIPMFLAYCHSFHHPKCFAPSSWHWPKVASPAMWAKFTASMSGLLSTGRTDSVGMSIGWTFWNFHDLMKTPWFGSTKTPIVPFMEPAKIAC